MFPKVELWVPYPLRTEVLVLKVESHWPVSACCRAKVILYSWSTDDALCLPYP